MFPSPGSPCRVGQALQLVHQGLPSPNPIMSTDVCTFSVQDTEVDSIWLRVFDLAGSLIFDAGWQAGRHVVWRGDTDDGVPLANGAYLYSLSVKQPDGEIVRLPTGTVFVSR